MSRAEPDWNIRSTRKKSRGGNRRRGRWPARRRHNVGDGFIARDGKFRFRFWISDAAVQHRHEREAESLRDDFQVAECQIAIIKLSIRDALFEQFIDQLLDLLRRRFFDAA